MFTSSASFVLAHAYLSCCCGGGGGWVYILFIAISPGPFWKLNLLAAKAVLPQKLVQLQFNSNPNDTQ